MHTIILQLFNVFMPIVTDMIVRHQQETGTAPTPEEMRALFAANIDKYLAEGDAWNAAHPLPVPLPPPPPA